MVCDFFFNEYFLTMNELTNRTSIKLRFVCFLIFWQKKYFLNKLEY